MNPRTYEGHMDWEYQGSGPRDPNSPFTHAAKGSLGFGGFGSPTKPNGRLNTFANASTPSKQQQPPPPTSRFTPQIPSKNVAPPFRNPAFTTPRRPMDEIVFSEASGAEDSPAYTEASDVPNDTPERDSMGDVAMGGMTHTKIDKTSRYGKSLFARKHASGKGEIKSSRDAPKLLRKRKRHNLDKDVGSVVRYASQETDGSGSESDSGFPANTGKARKKTSSKQQRGIFSSMLHILDEHPNAPENLHRWIQLGINVSVAAIVLFIVWVIITTIRRDIIDANDQARAALQSRMTECKESYILNECAKNDRPALTPLCNEWNDCMMQNPESIMRIKVTAKQIAEIINEFSDAMNYKAWAFFFAVLIVCILGNNMVLGRQTAPKAFNYPAQHNAAVYNPASPSHDANGAVMWMPVATPRAQRQGMLEDGSDTDGSQTHAKPMRHLQYTPMGGRSPHKGARERSRSPVKYTWSPSKGF